MSKALRARRVLQVRSVNGIALVCAITAVALAWIAALGTMGGDGVSALVHVSDKEPMAAFVPSGFKLFGEGAHYDGVYFYAIAADPFADGFPHQIIDLAAYRYGHPGYGWLAWAASGGGDRGAIPYALVAVSLAGIAIAAALVSLLAQEVGMSPWWGLSVALNPGLLFAVTADTSETVGLALALGAVLAWSRGRYFIAGLALFAGCFTKEPLLLIPVALAVWEGLVFVRRRTIRSLAAKGMALAAGPLAYIVWVFHVRSVLGVLPSSQINQLSFPLDGWIGTAERARGLTEGTNFDLPQVGMVTVPLLVVVGGLLLLGIGRALRLSRPLDTVFIALAGLALCTNWVVLLFPKDLVRTVALPLALLPFVLCGRGPAIGGGSENTPEG